MSETDAEAKVVSEVTSNPLESSEVPVHFEVLTQSENSNQSESSAGSGVSDQVFYCLKCSESFYSEESYNEHLIKEHINKVALAVNLGRRSLRQASHYHIVNSFDETHIPKPKGRRTSKPKAKFSESILFLRVKIIAMMDSISQEQENRPGSPTLFPTENNSEASVEPPKNPDESTEPPQAQSQDPGSAQAEPPAPEPSPEPPIPQISVRSSADLMAPVTPSMTSSDSFSALNSLVNKVGQDMEEGHVQPPNGVHQSPGRLSPLVNLPNIEVSKRPHPDMTSSLVVEKRTKVELPRLPPGVSIGRFPEAGDGGGPAPAAPLTSLSLPSGVSLRRSSDVAPTPALSITPAKPKVEKLFTVDLTSEPDPVRPPPSRRPTVVGRPPRVRFSCRICDKNFLTQEALNVHVKTHDERSLVPRASPNSSPVRPQQFTCQFCSARYPNQMSLNTHMAKFHPRAGAPAPLPELGIPLVDMRDPDSQKRLAQLGIKFLIPMSQIHSNTNGVFCIPLLPVDGAPTQPGVCSIKGLGATNMLPLGKMRSLK